LDVIGEDPGALEVSVRGDGDEARGRRWMLLPEALPDRQLVAAPSPRRPDEHDERVAEVLAQA
jgi:hypothetical protein